MKTNCYYSTNLSSLNWIKDFNSGIYKVPLTTISAYDYEHPAIDNIPLIEYNYTRNSVLSNMSLNSFMILDGYFYVNFGNINPNTSLSELQMGLSSIDINAASDISSQSTKLELYSVTNNNLTVTDNSNNTISPNSSISRPPYYRSYIQPNTIFPLTVHNAGITQAITTSSGNSSSSGVMDVEVNGNSVVIDGVAQIDNSILKPQSEWTSEDKLSIKNTLGLNGFVESVDSLIPETEISAEQVGTTYLLTQFNPEQAQYVPGKLYTVIADTSTTPTSYKYQEVGSTSLPVGSVRDIRFLCQDNGVGSGSNTLRLSWKDPDDLVINGVVVSKWQNTMVRYLSFAENDETAHYPLNPNDGFHLFTNSQKNSKTSSNPLKIDNLPKLRNEQGEEISSTVYYIRFFPCNTNDVYTIDTVNPNDNRVCTDGYTWGVLNSYLEDFYDDISSTPYPDISAAIKLLPNPGDPISIKYLMNDYYMNGNTKVNVYHRNDEDEIGGIITNVANGNLVPVDTDWIVLGYNKTVPRYIKYRRTNESTGNYEYIFASSVDDSTTTMQFKDLGENTVFEDKEIVTGTLMERGIGIGCRVYTRTYDERETEWTYKPSEFTISNVSDETFIYGSGDYSYSVPRTITINDKVYDFHGYTMTLQPKSCLRTNGYSGNQATMQFKAGTDPIVDVISEKFDPSRKYYKVETDISTYKFVEISGTSEELIQDRNYDVYTIDSDNRLKLLTEYYKPGILAYSLDNNTHPTGYIAGHLYSKRINDGTSDTTTALSACYKWKPNTYYSWVSASPLYVLDNNKIYKVKANVPLSSTLAPSEDNTHYDDISVEINVNTPWSAENAGFCIYGTKIPTDPNNIKTIRERTPNTSCSLYELSWYRFWINDKYGYGDRNKSWKKKNIFDVQSTSGMASSNGLRARLLAEPDFLKQLIPVINPTFIKNTWAPFSDYYYKWRSNDYYLYFPTDYFFPLSGQEVGFDWRDGTDVFSDVYTSNNTSRIKVAMNLDGTIPSGNGVNWWVRTPYINNAYYENIVNSSGSSNLSFVTTSIGVCPACTIG